MLEFKIGKSIYDKVLGDIKGHDLAQAIMRLTGAYIYRDEGHYLRARRDVVTLPIITSVGQVKVVGPSSVYPDGFIRTEGDETEYEKFGGENHPQQNQLFLSNNGAFLQNIGGYCSIPEIQTLGAVFVRPDWIKPEAIHELVLSPIIQKPYPLLVIPADREIAERIIVLKDKLGGNGK